jgi:myo-inositol 2-dehydrogenase/D-chiro-inositol 1-dehydrogenase
MNRRDFIRTGRSRVRVAYSQAGHGFGYQANSAVRLGLLGCGSRGTHVATSFAQNTTAQVVALGRSVPDQLAAGRAHFDQLNAGLGRSAHRPQAAVSRPACVSSNWPLARRGSDSDLHAAVFSRQHLEAAVARASMSTAKSLWASTCHRRGRRSKLPNASSPRKASTSASNAATRRPLPPLRRRSRRRAGQDRFRHRLLLRAGLDGESCPGASADEYRLRNWLWDRALSGDILVEQNIHIIDLCNWILGAHPLKATATGGRNILTHAGDCWDNYQVDFTYPGDVHVSFASTQFGDYGLFEAGLRLFGADGAATVPYAGPCEITGRSRGRGRTQ